jgi:hypothetical protein
MFGDGSHKVFLKVTATMTTADQYKMSGEYFRAQNKHNAYSGSSFLLTTI